MQLLCTNFIVDYSFLFTCSYLALVVSICFMGKVKSLLENLHYLLSFKSEYLQYQGI